MSHDSGGSRISPRRGRQLPRGGAPTYNFVKISQKLHEIERIWTPSEGRASKILLCRSVTAWPGPLTMALTIVATGRGGDGGDFEFNGPKYSQFHAFFLLENFAKSYVDAPLRKILNPPCLRTFSSIS